MEWMRGGGETIHSPIFHLCSIQCVFRLTKCNLLSLIVEHSHTRARVHPSPGEISSASPLHACSQTGCHSTMNRTLISICSLYFRSLLMPFYRYLFIPISILHIDSFPFEMCTDFISSFVVCFLQILFNFSNTSRKCWRLPVRILTLSLLRTVQTIHCFHISCNCAAIAISNLNVSITSKQQARNSECHFFIQCSCTHDELMGPPFDA